MSVQSYLENLAPELLVKIFSYLEIKDLCNLSISCKRFKEVISLWDKVIINLNPLPLATNQMSEIFLSKCFKKLKNIDKLRISNNWKMARYSEQTLLYTRRKYIPYLQLSDQFLWMSHGSTVNCYERTEAGVITDKSIYTLKGTTDADVVNFKKKNNLLVVGLRGGTLRLHNLEELTTHEFQLWHNTDATSVDICNRGHTVVSGARDGGICVVTVNDEKFVKNSLKKLLCPDFIWKVSLSEENRLAVGISGNVYHDSSLLIYDIIRDSKPVELHLPNRRTRAEGVLDIKWDGLHMLWSCGYDSVLRRWDLRTGRNEQSFMDPCGSVLYCLDYDHVNTVMTGAHMNGRVMLWDTRQRSAVQLYFLESCKKGYNRSSPVYSLQFDSEFLFAATDQNLNVLNFSTYDQIYPKDYTFFLDSHIKMCY